MMNWFKKASDIHNGSDPAKAEITPEKIVLGEFIDIKKPTYGQLLLDMGLRVQKKVEAGGGQE
jgi:hypothetical protein